MNENEKILNIRIYTHVMSNFENLIISTYF